MSLHNGRHFKVFLRPSTVPYKSHLIDLKLSNDQKFVSMLEMALLYIRLPF